MGASVPLNFTFLRFVDLANSYLSYRENLGFGIFLQMYKKIHYVLYMSFLFFFGSWLLMGCGYYVTQGSIASQMQLMGDSGMSDDNAFRKETKYGSIPAAMYYVLINLCGEHPM